MTRVVKNLREDLHQIFLMNIIHNGCLTINESMNIIAFTEYSFQVNDAFRGTLDYWIQDI